MLFALWYFLSRTCPIGSYTPSFDVYGSYFPAWLICLIVGIILTILVIMIGRIFNLLTIRSLVP